MSNLCSEVLQVQKPSIINDAQEFVKMGTDISCNLGSTNVVNMMTSPDFGRSIKAMTRALTFVSDTSSIEAVPTIKHGNEQAHTSDLVLWDFTLILPKTTFTTEVQNLSSSQISILCCSITGL